MSKPGPDGVRDLKLLLIVDTMADTNTYRF